LLVALLANYGWRNTCNCLLAAALITELVVARAFAGEVANRADHNDKEETDAGA